MQEKEGSRCACLISSEAVVRELSIQGRRSASPPLPSPPARSSRRGGHLFDLQRATLARIAPELGPARSSSARTSSSVRWKPRSRRLDDFSDPARAIPTSAFTARSCLRPCATSTAAEGPLDARDWAMTDDDAAAMECRCGAKACHRTVSDKTGGAGTFRGDTTAGFSSYLEEKITAPAGPDAQRRTPRATAKAALAFPVLDIGPREDLLIEVAGMDAHAFADSDRCRTGSSILWKRRRRRAYRCPARAAAD